MKIRTLEYNVSAMRLPSHICIRAQHEDGTNYEFYAFKRLDSWDQASFISPQLIAELRGQNREQASVLGDTFKSILSLYIESILREVPNGVATYRQIKSPLALD
jgi:hypothetical protein